MGIAKNFFENLFGKLNIDRYDGNVRIRVNFTRMGRRMDIAQDALDAQVWDDVKKYMPYDSYNLIRQTETMNAIGRVKVYTYDPNVEYGHYQYEGVQYIDPKYGVAGFYDEKNDKFFSRKGVTKEKSEQPLIYSNPNAEAHWDEKAYNLHHKDWVRVVKRALRR